MKSKYIIIECNGKEAVIVFSAPLLHQDLGEITKSSPLVIVR